MNIQDINTAIIHRQWTNAELMSMTDAIRFARKRLTERSKAELAVGDSVVFDSAKQGRVVRGTVLKIAIKYVTVREASGGLWKVPANMLSKVGEDVYA